MPTDIADNTVVTGDTFNTVKPGEVKMFTKCCEVAKTKLCMHQDVKNEAEVTIDNRNAKTSQGLYCLKLNRLIIIHLSHSQHGHSRSSESCPKKVLLLVD